MEEEFKDLTDQQHSMLKEQEALTEKITQLRNYIDYSDSFANLDREEQEDMRMQAYHMQKYSNYLQTRIDRQGI